MVNQEPFPADSNSGFSAVTGIYSSLRPPSPLPPATELLSATDYIFSFFHQSQNPYHTASLIDATAHRSTPYSELPRRVQNLAASLKQRFVSDFSHGGVTAAFILSPNSDRLPVLFLSLFSLNVAVSPSNPASSIAEISHQIRLCKPSVTFATSETAHKLTAIGCNPVILDSDEFESMMTVEMGKINGIDVSQSDTAAIMYSSGTTGKIKGVKLSHRNLMSVIAGAYAGREIRTPDSPPAVTLCTVPYFHVYGFVLALRLVAFGESVASMQRFDLRSMLRSIEEFKVTNLAVAPPVVVAMVNSGGLLDGYNCSSLQVVFSGGAPLTKAVLDKFKRRFPNVPLIQAYGLTETTGGISRIVGLSESAVVGTVGRLVSYCEAKIVDPHTGICLPPMKSGELWLRGPFIMKGYVSDKEATSTILDSEGWLRTGDLCYFDNKGFLFYVDRLKELIKYKGYQVPPAELEHILQSHPDIAEAAVVPFPDEEAGQVPMAFVVRRPGSSIIESQIMDFVAKQVAPYKKLRRVSFINTIPKNAPGKVLRKELIKQALSNCTCKL